MNDTPRNDQLVKPLPLTFLLGLVLVNAVALFRIDYLHIGAFFSFLFIILAPGILLLPFLTKEKLPLALGIAISAALSVFLLMTIGLAVNAILPLFGFAEPLATIPLLLAFDILVYALLSANKAKNSPSPFEQASLGFKKASAIGALFLIPVMACLGAIVLNNGGTDTISLITLALVFFAVFLTVAIREKLGGTVPPAALYATALAMLLMNSMRGWFITGHDVTLEYHVFTLVQNARAWRMSLYQDPYMACLSITILPVYLQGMIHTSGTYIFKFFLQFLGALPVVFVYYLAKKYVSGAAAFLAGFLYIAFPTFMTDMAFLNRQSIAFVFFGAMLLALLSREYFKGRTRNLTLLVFGTGMVLSHYATSYVAVAALIAAYAINRILRTKGAKDKPLLLTLPFVIILLGLVALWSVFITNTSGNLFSTIRQVAANLEDPMTLGGKSTGPASYGLLQSQGTTPQALLKTLAAQDVQQAGTNANPSNFYPFPLTETYTTVASAEPLVPITGLGETVQGSSHINLPYAYESLKQLYAKIMQVLLLLGTLGLLIRYGFRNNVLQPIPTEYTALSISFIAVLAGQTLLPATAVDYGLLRLFQQSLIVLGLPIILTLLAIGSFLSRRRGGVAVAVLVLLFFFAILSGFIPQFTGGARPPLTLNNYGFYYDSYYTHAQEISSIDWLATNANRSFPVQAGRYFSATRILAYSGIAPNQNLVPQTIMKDSYVYLDNNNVKSGNFIDEVGGDVIYYQLPMTFLSANKNLIYNNGSSEIYK